MKCTSCGKEIKFLRTKNGKTIPINMETIQGNETIYDHTIGHISHFSDCRDANKFRKPKGVG